MTNACIWKDTEKEWICRLRPIVESSSFQADLNVPACLANAHTKEQAANLPVGYDTADSYKPCIKQKSHKPFAHGERPRTVECTK